MDTTSATITARVAKFDEALRVASEVVCFRKTRKAAERYAQFCRDNETPDWVYWVEPVDAGYEVRVRPA